MPHQKIAVLRQALLSWYEQEGRSLPWRPEPANPTSGHQPDPYAVWLSEIMLQQTTVAHATPYFVRFLERWPTIHDLATADREDVLAAWAGLGYYARARKLIECAGILVHRGGVFPSSEEELLDLPGIGPYTAAAIRAIAFDKPATVVDGNVERVMARLHAVGTPLPRAKKELRCLAAVLADPDHPGDYAQALMDLGATVCTPRNPRCERCPWAGTCAARQQGAQADFPLRAPRQKRPERRGVAFVVLCDETIWLRTRPDNGLLGGMLEVPSTPWRTETWSPEETSRLVPCVTDWSRCGEVRHTFTHFSLQLDVWRGQAPTDWAPSQGKFYPLAEYHHSALPSVMRKVIELAAGISVEPPAPR